MQAVTTVLSPWLLVVLLAAAGSAWQVRYARTQRAGREGEAQVDALLRRFFSETARNLYLPNGHGGLTEIDHAALTNQGILLLETKHYSGEIRGRSTDEHWTKRNHRGTVAIRNPLLQHSTHLRCVERLGLDVPLIGLIVITGGATFPHGIPDVVRPLGNLPSDLKRMRGDVDPAYQQAWQRLLASARTDRAAAKQHLREIESRHGRSKDQRRARMAFGASALLAAGLAVYHILVRVEPAVEPSDTRASLPMAPTPEPEPPRPAVASLPQTGRQPGQLSRPVSVATKPPVMRSNRADDLWTGEGWPWEEDLPAEAPESAPLLDGSALPVAPTETAPSKPWQPGIQLGPGAARIH